MLYKCADIVSLNDYFKKYSERNSQGIYFYRINGFNNNIKNFITEYFKIAEKYGAVIEEKIQNPTEKNLEYYEEMLGNDFVMSVDFISNALKKWTPEIGDFKIKNLAMSMYDVFDRMTREGKNLNIIKNAYIKFMCWLYYKFKRVLNLAGDNDIPKILYQGNITMYELKFISVLAGLGCDVVVLQYEGDENYKKVDNRLEYSKEYRENDFVNFPNNFSIDSIRKEVRLNEKIQIKRENSVNDVSKRGTNIWLSGDILKDVLKNPSERGTDKNIYYNCFVRMAGTDDKAMYTSELYKFYSDIKNSNRNVVICDKGLGIPSVDEISKVRRGIYNTAENMALDIAKNINYNLNKDICDIIRKNFVEIILEESRNINGPLNRVTNKAVYIMCWLNRFVYDLYKNIDYRSIPVFILFGVSENENQGLFLRFLSRLPVDVVVISPDINKECVINDKLLFEKKLTYSVDMNVFPRDNVALRAGTTAYHAERELENIMYTDSGLYKNRQYNKADSLSLNTMYEEIYILWEQDMKYRPNFQTLDDVVKMPVIYAKVSGVKEGNTINYWKDIKRLLVKDTYLIKKAPFIKGTDRNPIKPYSTEFFKNRRLIREKIKNHNAYQYKFIRDEMQEHILDKLEMLINSRIIKGTFERGTEYTIISTVLNLNKDILRLIQNFDFTKKNPKIVFINTGEKTYSLEDAIVTAFLNLIGFDIIFFVPTGYKGIELYFNECEPEEHQIGEYMYDLPVPDFNRISSASNRSFMDIIFKRGS